MLWVKPAVMGTGMWQERSLVTDMIQISCSRLCHGALGFTAAACRWKSLSYLAHTEPLMSRARVRTMEAYVATSNARLALKCIATT